MRIRKELILFITLVTSVSGVHAAPLTWTTEGVSVDDIGDSIVETDGTLIEAVNLTPNGDDRTVNGVTFVSAPSHSDFGTTAINGHDADADVSVEFDAMLDTFGWTGPPGQPSTLALIGLSVGNTYLVQLFASDDRFPTRVQEYSDGATTTAQFTHGSSHTMVGTFQADAVTQDIILHGYDADGTTDRSSIVNAFQVRETEVIPEPSTVALFLLGTALFWRRNAGR